MHLRHPGIVLSSIWLILCSPTLYYTLHLCQEHPLTGIPYKLVKPGTGPWPTKSHQVTPLLKTLPWFPIALGTKSKTLTLAPKSCTVSPFSSPFSCHGIPAQPPSTYPTPGAPFESTNCGPLTMVPTVVLFWTCPSLTLLIL